MIEFGYFCQSIFDKFFGFSVKRQAVHRLIKKFSYRNKFWALRERSSQKIFFELQHNLIVLGLQSVIKVEMRNVGANQHQITFQIARHMLAYMPDSCLRLDVNQLNLRMIMP